MSVYVLKHRDNLDESNPWTNNVGCLFGTVVVASSESEARDLAAGFCGKEGMAAWLDPQLSYCSEVNPKGSRGVILRDCRPESLVIGKESKV